jgi:hypothetical protein
LRDHCSELLKKEKAEIIEVANQNNIPLDSLGLDDDEDKDIDDDEITIEDISIENSEDDEDEKK